LNGFQMLQMVIQLFGLLPRSVFQLSLAIMQSPVAKIPRSQGRADDDCSDQQRAPHHQPADRRVAGQRRRIEAERTGEGKENRSIAPLESCEARDIPQEGVDSRYAKHDSLGNSDSGCIICRRGSVTLAASSMLNGNSLIGQTVGFQYDHGNYQTILNSSSSAHRYCELRTAFVAPSSVANS